MEIPFVTWLPAMPSVPDDFLRRVRADYESEAVPSGRLEDYLLDRYDLDVRSHYGGEPIAQPFGKASGQLSTNLRQVEEDIEAGLGFVVLKTVIAQDDSGAQAMEAWAVREAKMTVEPIVGGSGATGWTVTWKGRGWWQSFDEYLELVRASRRAAAGSKTLIVPSCKYHLPAPDEPGWKVSEYDHTTQALLAAWNEGAAAPGPMPIEKDFSPTLAGSDRAAARAKILEWLRETPALMRAAVPAGSIRVGLKLFNALFDDEFQLEMLRAIHDAAGSSRPDFHIYGNRLFDPRRVYEGHAGVAYGGPDLSDRNLRVMARLFDERATIGPGRGDGKPTRADSSSRRANGPLPWSATGNIVTGRLALEYALRGASSFQLHTFYQLPSTAYRRATGSKTRRALHELYFHPETGFVVWMRHLANERKLPTEPTRFADVVGAGRGGTDR